MKSHQISIRFTEDSMKRIEGEAVKDKVTVAGYIRTLIEESFNIDKISNLEERVKQLEIISTQPDFSQLQMKFLMGFAHLLSVDKELPIDLTLSKIRNIVMQMVVNPVELNKLSRRDRERLYRKIGKDIINEFKISELAKLILDGIFLGFLSFTYDTEIFQPYGLSMDLIERFKKIKILVSDDYELSGNKFFNDQ